MIHKIFHTALLVVVSTFLHAQTLQTWTWDTYKIKFKAPDNLILQKNDATVYEATNKSMAMDIYPRKGENLTYDGMKNSLVTWANSLSLNYNSQNSDGTTQPIYLENVNGYWGCAIDGTKNDFPSTVVLLVNPDNSDVVFYIWISYAREYYHDAIAILKSFTPM